jgi:hypothetical protein
MKDIKEYIYESINLKRFDNDEITEERFEDVIGRYPKMKGEANLEFNEKRQKYYIYLNFASPYGSSDLWSINGNHDFAEIHYKRYCFDINTFEKIAYERQYGREAIENSSFDIFSDDVEHKWIDLNATSLRKYKNKGMLFAFPDKTKNGTTLMGTIENLYYVSSVKLDVGLRSLNIFFKESQSISVDDIDTANKIEECKTENVLRMMKDALDSSSSFGPRFVVKRPRRIMIYPPTKSGWSHGIGADSLDFYILDNYIVAVVPSTEALH